MLMEFLAVGVIRMIKLFGWEYKMAGRLDNKRKEELQWLWKLKVNFTVTSIAFLHLIRMDRAVSKDYQRALQVNSCIFESRRTC